LCAACTFEAYLFAIAHEKTYAQLGKSFFHSVDTYKERGNIAAANENCEVKFCASENVVDNMCRLNNYSKLIFEYGANLKTNGEKKLVASEKKCCASDVKYVNNYNEELWKGAEMRYGIILFVLLASVFSASAFELHWGGLTSANVLVGETADFELYVVNPLRMIDTIDFRLVSYMPSAWNANACTPYYCFTEFADHVLPGPDSALVTIHATPTFADTGQIVLRISSRRTAQADSMLYTVGATLAIEEKQLPARHKMSAFPNPFNSVCNITFDIVGTDILSICDLSGKRVYESEIAGSGTANVDFSSFSGGVYFVFLNSTIADAQKVVYMK